jgi:hypothetical protein
VISCEMIGVGEGFEEILNVLLFQCLNQEPHYQCYVLSFIVSGQDDRILVMNIFYLWHNFEYYYYG